MFAERQTPPPSLHADELHIVAQKCMKNTDGVGTAAHAREDRIRQTALGFQNIRASLDANAAAGVTARCRRMFASAATR
jgi:hypothetical protein